MKLRTTTRDNGFTGVRDVHWGVEVIGTVAAILLAISAAWISMNREMSALAADQRSFQGEVIRHLERSDSKDDGFVGREEYEHHNHGGRVPQEGGQ